MANSKLSATMAVTLAETIDRGGELIRLAGGFWTYPDCPRRPHDGVPTWWVGASTVNALVTRGAFSYTEWKHGKSTFPIRVAICADYLDSGEIAP